MILQKLYNRSIMYNSKIDELSQSTFRQYKPKTPIKPSRMSLGLAQSYQQAEERPDPKQLLQFQLKMPPCPFHNQPIRFLCLRTDCQCSTYGLCSLQECRNLHQDPDADLIQLTAFNELVRDNCSSLLMLSQKMTKYLKQMRENLIHRLDISIERSLYLLNKVYLQEVPNLIRMKQLSKLSSQKLGHFVKFELSEGSKIRNKMEALKNSISARITDRQNLVQRLCSSKDYQFMVLSDIVKLQQSTGNQILSKAHLTDFDSHILPHREQMQLIIKFLRENRASMFSKISLLFRASQHQFKPQAFHKAVDGKSPTLFLVKTTLDKVFGAYINCKLNDRQDWIPDATGLSFLFSIDKQQSFRLKGEAQSRLKAAFGGISGPQLGSGCDLYISQDCHLYRKSGSNLGGSYRLPGFIQFNTSKSRSYLAGQQFFQVKQYEFFLFQ